MAGFHPMISVRLSAKAIKKSEMKTPITITSDFLCPWCYLAEARLRKALDECGDAVDAEIVWRPFELNPSMPAEGMDRKAYRSRKFGWERSKMMDSHLEALGRADGIAFDFSRITRAPNTRLAHRLLTYAERHGRATDYARRVFEDYFERGLDIGSKEVLMQVVASLGLDPHDAEHYLDGGGGLAEVVAAEKAAVTQGINGVPQFRIGQAVISGAQAGAVLKEALLRASSRFEVPVPKALTDRNC